MKIGVVNINYDCAATLDSAFASWAAIRSGALSGVAAFISSSHVCFPETASLGFPIKSVDKTWEKLESLFNFGFINAINFYKDPREEQIAWTDCLKKLPEDADYIWMLNSDELWRIEEIKTVIDFVRANPFVDIFHVNFKNYFGRGKYVDNFVVPRIWNAKRRGGVERFYKDDLVQFKDGTYDLQAVSMTIPKRKVFPAHYSWSLPPECSDEENEKFVKRKLGFQKLRYANCSYKWDDEKGLILNEEYYRMIGQPLPEVFHE